MYLFRTRGWDKLVAVLFHGSWTQESQHAVSILQNLAGRQQPHHRKKQDQRPSWPRGQNACDRSTAATSGGTPSGAGLGTGAEEASTIPIVLAEADVMSLIDVADRQAITGLPSLHVHFGGREIVRFPVDRSESVDSLGARIDEVASRVCGAGWR